MTSCLPFSAGDRTGEFRFFPGTVIDTDQRSDSYVTGRGRMFVLEGTGGGASQTSTEVVVARDIWMQDSQGAEHHLRVSQDVPVRAGQQIGLVYYRDTATKPGQADRLVTIFIVSTNKSYAVEGVQTVTALLDPKNHTKPKPYILAAWAVSIGLCVCGVGLLGVFALLVRYFIVEYQQKAVTGEVLAAVEEAHQRVLNILYEERAKLEMTPQLKGHSQLQGGSAA